MEVSTRLFEQFRGCLIEVTRDQFAFEDVEHTLYHSVVDITGIAAEHGRGSCLGRLDDDRFLAVVHLLNDPPTPRENQQHAGGQDIFDRYSSEFAPVAYKAELLRGLEDSIETVMLDQLLADTAKQETRRQLVQSRLY